jgi:cyclase
VSPATDLAVRIIPCLDVAAGRVVKGLRFADLRDHGDPADCAERYAAAGADELVFLDVAATGERRGADLTWVERVAERVFVPLTVGGGIAAVEDARRLFLAGADKVAVNSAAVARPALVGELAERFGAQAVLVSVDVRRRGDATGWEVCTQGGRKATGLDAVTWVRAAVERGAGEVLLTSIDADGTRQGYDLELVRRVARAVRVPVIASGGAGSVAHLAAALEAGAAAVLAASIFHRPGRHDAGIAGVKRELAARGFVVRQEAA